MVISTFSRFVTPQGVVDAIEERHVGDVVRMTLRTGEVVTVTVDGSGVTPDGEPLVRVSGNAVEHGVGHVFAGSIMQVESIGRGW